MEKIRNQKMAFMARRWSAVMVCTMLLTAALLPGCIKQRQPAQMIDRHIFEYSPPALPDLAPLNQLAKVERFSVAKAYNSLAIVYRPESHTLDTYADNRWITKPGDMVSDFLLRDLRSTNIFRAVFSYRDPEDARYVIGGSVEELVERDETNGRSAAITLNVTLLDLSRTGMESRLLFQKEYRAVEPMKNRSPSGLVQAMSVAMARLSEAIIRDVHGALHAARP